MENTTKRSSADNNGRSRRRGNSVSRRVLLAALLTASVSTARAAGSRDGLATASAEAASRLSGAVLTEIEGFADTGGTIPCAGKSFSKTWHYKFYAASTREWLLVNACAGTFIDASKQVPSMDSDDPTSRLPAVFADSPEILKKLAATNAFRPAPNSLSRDILMNIRVLPKKDNRPAGCYWTVSQGKAKVVTDCDGKKVWSPAGATAPAAEEAKKIKAKDPAGKYTALANATAHTKYPGAVLMAVETMTDRNGSAKCVSDMDGWAFTFNQAGITHAATFKACRGKTSLDELGVGEAPPDFRKLSPLPDTFKDSDAAIAQIPKDSRAASSTFTMTLRKFKPGMSPVKGHSFIWEVDCGTLKYYVDAYTALYLGGGEAGK